ncbi:hypothetical protein TrRE_jg99, partial [Triparma retinervis]
MKIIIITLLIIGLPNLCTCNTTGSNNKNNASPPYGSVPSWKNLRTSEEQPNHSPLGRSILTTPHRPLPSLHLTSPFTPPNVVNYTKRQLSNLVGCGYRDLRCLDSKYDARGKGSVLLPRDGGLIVKVCLSRAVIVKHRGGDRVSCYVFPGTPHSEELV